VLETPNMASTVIDAPSGQQDRSLPAAQDSAHVEP
jgi:hypothetical protein